jgi:hypothetical protein
VNRNTGSSSCTIACTGRDCRADALQIVMFDFS